MGSLRVGHDRVTSLSLFTFMHWKRKWLPTPMFLPGKSDGERNLVGYSPWGWKTAGHDSVTKQQQKRRFGTTQTYDLRVVYLSILGSLARFSCFKSHKSKIKVSAGGFLSGPSREDLLPGSFRSLAKLSSWQL